MAYIELKQVSYKYEGRSKPAVDDVNIHLERSEKVALTGLNGSGKSTLARLILGLLKPQSGTVLLDGLTIGSYSLSETGKRLGYILQNPSQMLFNATVYNEIAFGLRWKGFHKEKLHQLCKAELDRFGLWGLKDRMPLSLSEGQKQLVAICAVMALQPVFLILDEPAKSIDSYRKKMLTELLNEINQEGTGIMIISHDRLMVKDMGAREIKMHKGGIA